MEVKGAGWLFLLASPITDPAQVGFNSEPTRCRRVRCSRLVRSQFHRFGHLLNSCRLSASSTKTWTSAPAV